MLMATEVMPGIIFDGRTVVLSMGALFGGPLVAAISAAMAAGFRIWLGGGGALIGVCVIATASGIGLLVRQAVSERTADISVWRLLAVSLAAHLAAVLWFLALPFDATGVGYFELAWPYVVILTPATAVTGLLLREVERMRLADQRVRESRDRFSHLVETSAVALFEEDVTVTLRQLEKLRRDGVEDLESHLAARPELTARLAGSVKIVHANPSAVRLFGAKNVQELCTDVRRLFGPKAETTFVNLLCALWSGRATFQHETDMRTLDGQIRRCVISLPLPQDMEAARQVPVSIIDITEQTEAEEQARSLGARLEKASLDAVGAVAAMVERRDPYTSGHQANVAALSVEIARKLGWDRFKIEGLRLGAMIHDIGKISVPSEILNRPGKLTDSEFAIIKAHPETGYDILKGTDFPWPIREMILQHHERLDGSGYPAGMRGDAILDETRVLSVADVLDAITSHRPYRPSRGIETALKEIEDGRGTYYDPAVVDAALELIRDEGYRWQKDLHESD
ncbi:MAG: hypothetical protein TEF_13140 [Rhizobiales bacterium NRL2]|jgi:putative nucleotidyltransferase with HDIG domain|nr:MAG: hypothetical protein TEF_13140 [Rhizobiales bacterium NRL2]